MPVFHFTVQGNNKDPIGNPMPYTRTTQGSKWSPKAKDYSAWKEYVRGCFLAYCVDEKLLTHADFRGLVYALPDLKPIVKSKKKARVDIMITYIDDTHADSDNVMKGVLDALFQNDKYVAGSFDYKYGDAGKVDITITI